MRDVVIIGGGLSGLAAAYELEKHPVTYTVIEVKPRLGGSIRSIQQNGFILDSGPFAVASADFPTALNLSESLYPLANGGYAFTQGTQTLVDALAGQVNGSKMMRMAVSSIGELDGGYSICMENGMVLDARALILAIPARYAQRLFYGYISDITELLLDYHYDTIQRVSLAYPKDAITLPDDMPPDMAYAFWHWTDHPARVPDGHILFHLGIRIDPAPGQSDDLIRRVTSHIGWDESPTLARVDYWPESDPISCYHDDHPRRMDSIRALLPPGIALIGGDYASEKPAERGIVRLHDRVRDGIRAARDIAEWLKR